MTPSFTLEAIVELSRVLQRKKFQKYFDQTPFTSEQLLRGVLKMGNVVEYHGPRIQAVANDLSDNMFLECLVASKASRLVTGDKDLLVLKSF